MRNQYDYNNIYENRGDFYQEIHEAEYTPTRELELDDSGKVNKKRHFLLRNIKTIAAFCVGIVFGVCLMEAKELVLEKWSTSFGLNSVQNSMLGIKSNLTGSASEDIGEITDTIKSGSLKASTLGIGGGDAMISPLISPHNNEEMLVLSEKGDLFLTYDKAKNWTRKYLNGKTLCAEYDPNKKGVIYVGGNGLYRSEDNGETFEIIFPNKDDIVAKNTHMDDDIQYFMTKSKVYESDKFVKSVVVDPTDSKHIFVLQFSGKKACIFESVDNGKSFRMLFEHEKDFESDLVYGLNKLIYAHEKRTLYWICDEFVMECTLEPAWQDFKYYSDLRIEDITSVYENGKTYFIICENTNDREDSYTKVFYTSDFTDIVDITSDLVKAAPRTFTTDEGESISYKFRFKYVAATSLDNIFVSSYTFAENSDYPYSIDALIQLHQGEARHALGKPFRVKELLVDRGWTDGDLQTLGIGVSKQNPCEFLLTTDFGLYYAANYQHIYARYCSDKGNFLKSGYVTNGIDTQSGYKVCEDPHSKKNMMIASIDAGLIKSTNSGNSWNTASKGIPSAMKKTAYDVEYNKYKKGVVYSIWSTYGEAGENKDESLDKEKGCFAISKDGGKEWDTKYSSGIPEHAIPCKLEVEYKGRLKEPTIYVATYNCGFYVSKDGGKTFKGMNKGLSKRGSKKYILATDITVEDGEIYGLIGMSGKGEETQPSELYTYKKGKWKQVDLPEDVLSVKDINSHKGTLYISSIATPEWLYKDNVDFVNYGGGLYTYKNGKFNQVFDEGISVTSSVVDSNGTLYVSDVEGSIYRKEKNSKFQKIYGNFHYVSTSLNISKDSNRLYLSTLGGGVLKLDNVKRLR